MSRPVGINPWRYDDGSIEGAKAALLTVFPDVADSFLDPYTVYTMIRHVTASGMSRDISVFAIINGEIQNISVWVAKVTGRPWRPVTRYLAIRMRGVGMDFTYAIVHELAETLYGPGQSRRMIRTNLY